MAIENKILAYGRPPLTEAEIEQEKIKYFKWIEARIKAEKLNPEPDYESERFYNLIEEIAMSHLDVSERQILILLLKKN